MLMIALASIFLLLSLTNAQSIVDFSYSQYVHREHSTTLSNKDVAIRPNRQTIEGYNFPEACFSASKLAEQSISESTELENFDYDTMVDELKIDIIELLRVGEKIRKKKSNIEGTVIQIHRAWITF